MISNVQELKKSKIKEKFERKIDNLIDKFGYSPYLETLVDLYGNFEDNKEIFYLLEVLDRMEKGGLGKQFFPLKYELVFLKDLKNKNLTNYSFLIGGWPIFVYSVIAYGIENAIRNFRGSHDLDKVLKEKFLIRQFSDIYRNNEAETRETHLNKYSFYVTDPVIKYEELENAFYNYRRFIKEFFDNKNSIKRLNNKSNMDEEVFYEISRDLNDKLKSLEKTNKDLINFINNNFYLNNIKKMYDKDQKSIKELVFDKFGRLELDIYYPQDNKMIKISDFEFHNSEFNNLIHYDLGELEFYLPNPTLLFKSKIKADRKKDYKDLSSLIGTLKDIPIANKKKKNLRDPEYYLESLGKDEIEKLYLGIKGVFNELSPDYKKNTKNFLKYIEKNYKI